MVDLVFGVINRGYKVLRRQCGRAVKALELQFRGVS